MIKFQFSQDAVVIKMFVVLDYSESLSCDHLIYRIQEQLAEKHSSYKNIFTQKTRSGFEFNSRQYNISQNQLRQLISDFVSTLEEMCDISNESVRDIHEHLERFSPRALGASSQAFFTPASANAECSESEDAEEYPTAIDNRVANI